MTSRRGFEGSLDQGGGEGRESFITLEQFCEIAKVSRRQLLRWRSLRPTGFPREYELGLTSHKNRRCPRFRLGDVLDWMETRALW